MGKKQMSGGWVLGLFFKAVMSSVGLMLALCAVFLFFIQFPESALPYPSKEMHSFLASLSWWKLAVLALQAFGCVVLAGLVSGFPSFVVGLWVDRGGQSSSKYLLDSPVKNRRNALAFWMTFVITHAVICGLSLLASSRILLGFLEVSNSKFSLGLLKGNEMFFFHNEGKKGKKVVHDAFSFAAQRGLEIQILLPARVLNSIKTQPSIPLKDFKWIRLFPSFEPQGSNDLQIQKKSFDMQDSSRKNLYLFYKMRPLHFFVRTGLFADLGVGPSWKQLWSDDHDEAFAELSSFTEKKSVADQENLTLTLQESAWVKDRFANESWGSDFASQWQLRKLRGLIQFLDDVWRQMPKENRPLLRLIPLMDRAEMSRLTWAGEIDPRSKFQADLSRSAKDLEGGSQKNADLVLTVEEWIGAPDSVDVGPSSRGSESPCVRVSFREQSQSDLPEPRPAGFSTALLNRLESRRALLCRKPTEVHVFFLADQGWESEKAWKRFSTKDTRLPINKGKGSKLGLAPKTDIVQTQVQAVSEEWPPIWLRSFSWSAEKEMQKDNTSGGGVPLSQAGTFVEVLDRSQSPATSWQPQIESWIRNVWGKDATQ